MQLLTVAITTAVGPLVSSNFQIRGGAAGVDYPTNMALQANFTYGSGGTSANAWVQTSLDSGITWIDIANFSFATASLRKVINLNPALSVPSFSPTDGTLAPPDSVKDGIFGNFWRVKYTTVGVYAGGTTLRIDAQTSGLRATLP
jgi:hypothetical protein